jgi:hypothetical protein
VRAHRRRGQGATESVILVGLIALLLLGVVQRFSHQIQVTFVGSTGSTDDITRSPFTGSPPRAPSRGSDGRWHGTDESGKPISAPDLSGQPGRWVYDG